MKNENTQKQIINSQFDDLVKNAFDFLNKSIDEIFENPKYTVIDFYTAVELFIKARLMKEHWSLIITKTESANLQKFLNGDFRSVSLKDAKDRLKDVVDDEISAEAYKCFNEIGSHRNRLVHFHNKSNDVKEEEIVAKQVLKGLYYLGILLTRKWLSHFEPYVADFSKINQRAYKLRDFLHAKFEILKPEIESDKLEGILYSQCLTCGLEASKISQIYKFIYSSICKVCDFEESQVKANCPNCKHVIYFGEGFNICSFCGNSIEINDLLEQFEPEQPYDKESQIEYFDKLKAIALCNECGWIIGKNTVHPLDEEFQKWLCVSCNKTFEHAGECATCAETFAFNEYDGIICSNCR